MAKLRELAGMGPQEEQKAPSQMTTLQKMAGGMQVSPEATGPAVDTAAMSQLRRGFASTISSAQLAARIDAASNPRDYEVFRIGEDNVSMADEYGADINVLSPDERRERINAVDKQKFEEKYGGIESGSGVELAGAFGGAVLGDPLMAVIPAGGSAKAASVIGASIGATDAALYSKLENGEISYGSAALGAAIGGVAGGAIYKLGEGFAAALESRIRSGVELDGDDVQMLMLEHLPSNALPAPQKALPALPDEDGIPLLSRRVETDPNAPVGGTDGIPILTDRQLALEHLPNPQKVAEEVNARMDLSKDNWMNDIDTLLEGQKKDLPLFMPEEIMQALDSGIAKYRDQLTPDEVSKVARIKKVYNNIIKGRDPLPVAKGVDDAEGIRLAKIQTRYGNEPIANLRDRRKVQKDYETQGKVEEEAMEYAEAITPMTPSGVPDEFKIERLGIRTPPAQNAQAGVAKAVAEGKIVNNSPMGQTRNPPVDMLRGAGDLASPRRVEQAMNIGIWEKFMSRPRAVVDKMGKAGRELNSRIKIAIADSDRAVLSRWQDLRSRSKAIYGRVPERFTPEQASEIMSVLNNPKMAGKVSRENAAMAAEMRKTYNDVLRDAMKAGVIDKAHGYKLLEKARTEGYAPRMWDFDYLATREGKDKFVRLLSEKGTTKQQMHAILNAVGESEARIKQLLSSMRPNRKGKYTLNADMAQQVWSRRDGFKQRTKANNLERSRSLDLDFEDIKDFLVKDPGQIMSQYLSDSYQAINYVKQFGKKSERADKLIGEIEYNYGSNARDFATEMFNTETRNRHSKALKAHRDLTNSKRTALQYAKTYQSLKLVMAQILNAGQSVVNGTLRMSSDVSMPKALFTSLKGIKDTFNKEGWEFASRSGAAAHHTLMHMMAEQGGGAKITDMFLTGTGFRAIETLNRMFAANMGKAHIETLASRVKKLQAEPSLSKGQQKMLREDIRSLDELGLDSRNIDGWTVEDIQRGAALFSDEINFRPGASSIPQNMQGPVAGLFRQFQSFALFQTAFIKDNVQRALRRGGVGPMMNTLAAFGVVAPAVGYPIEEFRNGIREWASGKETPEADKANAWVQGMMATGMLGMFVDYGMKSYDGGLEKAAFGLLGPTAGDAAKLTRGIAGTGKRLAEGKFNPEEPLLDAMLRTTPLGSAWAERAYGSSASGYKTPYKSNYSGQIGQ